MTDFKKVAVTITDAEGVEHRIGGYQYPTGLGKETLYQTNSDQYDDDAWTINIADQKRVTIEEVRTLPTGIGAVVEIVYGPPINDHDHWVRIDANTWSSPQGHFKSDASLFDGKDFTVLAEGVEL